MEEAKRQQNASIWHEIDSLRHQTVGQLKAKYREVFGQESRSNHKQFPALYVQLTYSLVS